MPRSLPRRSLIARLRLSNGAVVEVDFGRGPGRWVDDLSKGMLAARATAGDERLRTQEDALGEEIRFLLATVSPDVKDLLLAHLLASAMERRRRRRTPPPPASEA